MLTRYWRSCREVSARDAARSSSCRLRMRPLSRSGGVFGIPPAVMSVLISSQPSNFPSRSRSVVQRLETQWECVAFYLEQFSLPVVTSWMADKGTVNCVRSNSWVRRTRASLLSIRTNVQALVPVGDPVTSSTDKIASLARSRRRACSFACSVFCSISEVRRSISSCIRRTPSADEIRFSRSASSLSLCRA